MGLWPASALRVSSCAISRPRVACRMVGCVSSLQGHPGLRIGGQQRWQHHRRHQRLGCHGGPAHQLVQRELLDAQVVFGSDLLGHHQIEAGLRFARVGHGGGADFEVALGRRELLGHGGFLGAHKGQRVGGGEHVEVGLCGAHDQVLLGQGERGLGHVHRQQGLVVGELVDGAVQRLAGRERDVLAVAAWCPVPAVDLASRPAGGRAQAHFGQQAGLGLVGAEEVGLVLRARRQEGGVKAASGFVQLHQVLGLCARGCAQGQHRRPRPAGSWRRVGSAWEAGACGTCHGVPLKRMAAMRGWLVGQ